eukprot:2750627-Rhodomonas_salina.2
MEPVRIENGAALWPFGYCFGRTVITRNMSLGPNSRPLPVLDQQSEAARPSGGVLQRQVLAGGPAYTTVDPGLTSDICESL